MANPVVTTRCVAIGFWLPLPPQALSPNARVHWATKAAAVKKYRELACVSSTSAFMPGPRPKWTKARTAITFNFHRKSRRDKDNFLSSLKSAFDGLVDSGVVVDDCGLSHDAIEFTVDKSQPAGVFIGVTDEAADKLQWPSQNAPASRYSDKNGSDQ